MQGYFESLRTEKIGTGLNVNIICPGPVYSNLLKESATDKIGEVCLFSGLVYSRTPSLVYSFIQKVGLEWSKHDKTRMTTDRCAHLSLVAIAHNLPEVWMSPSPILQLMYLVQYAPALSKV